jgi:thermostable 8-oxoguanine DNA glycosylase
LKGVTGVRRYNRIAAELTTNLDWLESGGWKEIGSLTQELSQEQRSVERKAARTIDDRFKGFGPKQARNFLQMLGLTQYEIPLDSRVIRWLNRHDFPVRLNASGLSDACYYEFALDGVQALCSKANVLPCIFDACVFASFDQGAWSDENLLW